MISLQRCLATRKIETANPRQPAEFTRANDRELTTGTASEEPRARPFNRMIAFDRVSKRYPSGQQALANLSFALARGEFAFITGHSGAGKSTLLKLVLGIERPSGGSLVVNGHDLMAMSPNMLPSYRRQIGTVFQDHQLLNDHSVFDNVALPLEISGLDPREGKRRVRAALDKVGLLSKERMSPMALSGGEQQMLTLCRTLMGDPDLIMIDEPTEGLAPKIVELVGQFLRELRNRGVSVLLIEQKLTIAMQISDRALVMGHGSMVFDGTPDALRANAAIRKEWLEV